MEGYEWLIWYICGSAMYIIYRKVFIRENEIMFKSKFWHHVSLLCMSYIFGIIIIPFFILILLIKIIGEDYEKYKMKFEEEELKKYRIEDAKRQIEKGLRLANNGELKASHECIIKAGKLLNDSL